jgi:hypothetical protein
MAMTTYVCPEFAATGIELQIIELQAQREAALHDGWTDIAAEHEREIALLWRQLTELVEQYPEASAPELT